MTDETKRTVLVIDDPAPTGNIRFLEADPAERFEYRHYEPGGTGGFVQHPKGAPCPICDALKASQPPFHKEDLLAELRGSLPKFIAAMASKELSPSAAEHMIASFEKNWPALRGTLSKPASRKHLVDSLAHDDPHEGLREYFKRSAFDRGPDPTSPSFPSKKPRASRWAPTPAEKREKKRERKAARAARRRQRS